MKYYWLRCKNTLLPDTYECSNCGAVSAERSAACPFCGKLLNGTRNKTDSFNVIDFLKESLENSQ